MIRIRKETAALIGFVLFLFILMYFLEIRRIGYAIKEYDELSSCQALKSGNSIYRLERDIEAASTCFIIRADNITLDLNNHILSGDGGEDYGVLVEAEGAVIKNGIIKNFDIGILVKSSRTTITDNQLENNFDSGLAIVSGYGAFVSDNLFLDNSYYGIKILGSSKNQILRNTLYENFDSGLFISGGEGNMVFRNIMALNSWNGITLHRTNNNLLSRNIARKNSWNGISLISSSGNIMTYNTFEGNNRGIYVSGGGSNSFSDTNLLDNPADLGAVYVANSNGNLFRNMVLESEDMGDYAISIISSGKEKCSGNIFQDISLGSGNIYSRTSPYSSNYGNVFLNVDYGKEVLTESANELKRQWWLEIYALEGGEAVQADIEIHDNFGDITRGRTDSKGYFRKALTDYVKTPGKQEQYSYRVDVMHHGKSMSKVIKMDGNKAEVFEF